MSGLAKSKLLSALSRAGKAHLLRLVVQDSDDAFPESIRPPESAVANRASPVPRGGAPCSADAANPARTGPRVRTLGQRVAPEPAR